MVVARLVILAALAILLAVLVPFDSRLSETEPILGSADLGRVQIRCNVSGATVSLAGISFTSVSERTLIVGNVPAGYHQVEASKEGYQPWRGMLAVKANATARLALILTENPPAAPAGEADLGRESRPEPSEKEPPAPADRIGELLAEAEEDFKALRLTNPTPGNAWSKYRAVLALEPDNEEARQGLRRIVDAYVLLARKAIGRGELDKAKEHIERAEKVIPGDSRLQAVSWRLEVERAAAAREPKVRYEDRPSKYETNSLGMKFVLIPAGSFSMGSPAGEGFEDERPVRTVTITRPFYIGMYEVTQLEYQMLIGENPSHFREETKEFKALLERPVERVDWKQASQFCLALSRLENRTYRLPTEAEWEYVARAGGGPTPALGTQGIQSQPVGQKVNGWGIYDMPGNVWEWCSDNYSPTYYAEGDRIDPQGPFRGSEKVARGGSFSSDQAMTGSTRSNHRGHFPPHLRDKTLGFRVVLEPDQPPETEPQPRETEARPREPEPQPRETEGRPREGESQPQS